MAIQTPLANTNVSMPTSPNAEALIRALTGSAQTAGQGVVQGINQAQAAQSQQNLEKLKDFLQSGDLAKQLEAAQNAADENGGRSVRVGDVSVGVDPSAQLAKTQLQNSIKAVGGAQKTYNSGTKQLQDELDSVTTGLNALKSNDQSSLGQLRAAMLSANGFKRFNEPEALANAPDSVKSQVSSILNKYGLGTEGGNLSDIQRGNAAKFFQGKLQELKDRHDTLKATALSQYAQNPGADPARLTELQTTLGGPLDSQLGKISKGLNDFATTAVPNTNINPAPAQSPGIMQQGLAALSHFFGRAPAPAPTPAAPPLSPDQAANLAAPTSFDPTAYLQGK